MKAALTECRRQASVILGKSIKLDPAPDLGILPISQALLIVHPDVVLQ